MSPAEESLLWITWFIIFLFLCIIGLNFIIAEISHIYEEIRPEVDRMVVRERAELIQETEEMMLEMMKDDKMFPKSLVSREVDL